MKFNEQGFNDLDLKELGQLVLLEYLDKSTEVINYLNIKYGESELEQKINDYIERSDATYRRDIHAEALEDDNYFLFYLHGIEVFEAMEKNDITSIAMLMKSSFVLSSMHEAYLLDFNDWHNKFKSHIFNVRAKQGALEKLSKDPKQHEKLFVKECWEKWKKEPLSYKSKTEFANDMLDKCEHLKSQKRITDWCREWEALTPS